MADVGLSERTSIVSVGFYQALLPISLITSYWPNKNPSSFVVVFLGCIRRLFVRRSLTNVFVCINTSLSRNQIGDEGTRCLGEGLKHENNKLTTLT